MEEYVIKKKTSLMKLKLICVKNRARVNKLEGKCDTCFVKKGLNANEKSIDPGQPAQS